MFSSCENGTYHTCCTNGHEMFTHALDSPIISVCMASKNKIVHGVYETQKSSSDTERMLINRPIHRKYDRPLKGKIWLILINNLFISCEKYLLLYILKLPLKHRHCLRVRYRTSRLRGYGSGTGPLDTDSRGPVPDTEPRL